MGQTLCSPLKVNQRFGGTCRLYLQGRRMNQAIKQLCLPPAFQISYLMNCNLLINCFAAGPNIHIDIYTQQNAKHDN
jgi:hypothetical protein